MHKIPLIFSVGSIEAKYIYNKIIEENTLWSKYFNCLIKICDLHSTCHVNNVLIRSDQVTLPDIAAVAGPKEVGFDPFFGLWKDVDEENATFKSVSFVFYISSWNSNT